MSKEMKKSKKIMKSSAEMMGMQLTGSERGVKIDKAPTAKPMPASVNKSR